MLFRKFAHDLLYSLIILSISDYAMSMETIIVGDERGQFVYRSSDVSRNVGTNKKHSPDAVALVFARDRNKARGNYSYVMHLFIFLKFYEAY